MAGHFRRRAARRAVAAVAVAVVVDPIGAVHALNAPTDQEIEHARDAQQRANEAVTDAQARLDELAAELDEARVHAASAVEAYNGARVELARARRAELTAVADAATVRGKQTTAGVELGRLAAAVYRSGGGFSDLGVVVNIVTDETIVDISEALAVATRSQRVVRSRWSAILDEAELAMRHAERQVAERVAAERAAAQALEHAEQAVGEHEDAVARAEDERDALMLELAAVRGTTAELERERRNAIERREQVEREREERQRAEQDAEPGRRTDEPAEQQPLQEQADQEQPEREQPEQEQPEREQPEQEQPEQEQPEQEQPEQEQADSGQKDDTEPEAQDTPTPVTSAEPTGSSFAGAANAQLAIDYARAQLGKPYVWAGAGPAGFDCSGLTMRAWERGGVQLTHWSVAQARQTVAVPYSDLRPGDLIFWSTNDAPSGTYHVALYIGDGEMIHAPSPGGQVEIQHVFYWRTPSFYTRVVA